jgi:hypothetical protein
MWSCPGTRGKLSMLCKLAFFGVDWTCTFSLQGMLPRYVLSSPKFDLIDVVSCNRQVVQASIIWSKLHIFQAIWQGCATFYLFYSICAITPSEITKMHLILFCARKIACTSRILRPCTNHFEFLVSYQDERLETREHVHEPNIQCSSKVVQLLQPPNYYLWLLSGPPWPFWPRAHTWNAVNTVIWGLTPRDSSCEWVEIVDRLRNSHWSHLMADLACANGWLVARMADETKAR